MTTVVMQQPTPTPPSSELQYGLHHIARHNAGSPLQDEWRQTDDYSQGLPTQSSYGSPGLMQQSVDPFMSGSYGDDQYSQQPTPDSIGLGIQYAGYGGQADYLSSDPSALTGSPYVDPIHTPMTPRSDTSFGGPRARVGRSAARSNSPSVLGSQKSSRVTKSRPKKSRSNKAVNSKTPKLDAPLSELTKGMDIEVRDMVKWVNRSDEERHAEAEKRNGYITRPMNSFMLYRSAYAERTKQWCLQNNHQVVSSVSGESWPMEPDHVREHYNELAKIERENHARAHPSYKFSPSKTPTASKKKRGDYVSDDEDIDNGTDSGDPDWEWRPRNDRSGRSSRPKRQGREAGYPAHSHFNGMFKQPTMGFEQSVPGYNWENPPRSYPYAMEQPDQYNATCFPQNGMGFPNVQYMPDGLQQDAMSGGMPNMMSQEHMFTGEPQMMGMNGHQVDPTLLSVGGPFGQDHNGNDQGQFDHQAMGSPWEELGGEGDHWAAAAHM